MPIAMPDEKIEKFRDNAGRAATLLKAVNNEARLLLLCQLTKGEKSVGELQELVGTSQSGMSQHLRLLRQLNLVNTSRRAQTIYYSLRGEEVGTLIETLYKLYCPTDACPANE